MGLQKCQKERVFRYLNGQIVNPRSNQGEYYFGANKPSNTRGNENCVHFYNSVHHLNDADCSWNNMYGTDFQWVVGNKKPAVLNTCIFIFLYVLTNN